VPRSRHRVAKSLVQKAFRIGVPMRKALSVITILTFRDERKNAKVQIGLAFV
jgi:hypothetical protein